MPTPPNAPASDGSEPIRAQMDALRAYSSHLAHDLNNQLATLRLGMQMLERSVRGGSGQDILRMVNRSLDRATHLVADMGIFASGVRGERETLHLADLLGPLEAVLTEEAGEEVAFSARLDGPLPAVEVQRESLARALELVGSFLLGRLVENAETPGYLELGATAVDGEVHIHLDASGPVVPHDAGEALFLPFYATDKTSRGAGLALAVGRRVLRDHDGELEVTAGPGGGTRLRLRLPVARGQVDQPRSAPPPQSKATPERTILVIDDEAPLLEILTGILQDQSFNVLAASSAAEGLKLFKRHHGTIALLVCDVKLPGMPGQQLVETLRTLRGDLPVLFLSGADLEEAGALPEGCEFIGKPFEEDALLAAVGRLVPS